MNTLQPEILSPHDLMDMDIGELLSSVHTSMSYIVGPQQVSRSKKSGKLTLTLPRAYYADTSDHENPLPYQATEKSYRLVFPALDFDLFAAEGKSKIILYGHSFKPNDLLLLVRKAILSAYSCLVRDSAGACVFITRPCYFALRRHGVHSFKVLGCFDYFELSEVVFPLENLQHNPSLRQLPLIYPEYLLPTQTSMFQQLLDRGLVEGYDEYGHDS